MNLSEEGVPASNPKRGDPPSPDAKQPKATQRFLMYCAGVNRDILLRCPSEWSKYCSIGTLVFLTACFALLSSGYTIHLAFDNFPVTCGLALLWAYFIFSFDRYMVMSLRKEIKPSRAAITLEQDPVKKKGLAAERSGAAWNQLYVALPRLIMAIFLGFVIAKPLELRLFNDRIEAQLKDMVKEGDDQFDRKEDEKINDLNQRLAGIYRSEDSIKNSYKNSAEYLGRDSTVSLENGEIRDLEKRRGDNEEFIRQNRHKETFYRTNAGPVTPGAEPVPYEQWVADAVALPRITENNKINGQLTKLYQGQRQARSKNDSLLTGGARSVATMYESLKRSVESQVDSLRSSRAGRRQKNHDAHENSKDLPSRLDALGIVAGQSDPIRWGSRLISLVFVIIEIAPVFVKLVTKRGSYDEILDTIESEVRIRQRSKLKGIEEEMRILFEKIGVIAGEKGNQFVKTERAKLAATDLMDQEFLEKLSNTYREIRNLSYEGWAKEEKARAKRNAARYYQQNREETNPSFLSHFWTQKNAAVKTEYCFRDDGKPENAFLYSAGDAWFNGTWSFNSHNHEIVVILSDQSKRYFLLLECSATVLKLRDQHSREIIEFRRAKGG